MKKLVDIKTLRKELNIPEPEEPPRRVPWPFGSEAQFVGITLGTAFGLMLVSAVGADRVFRLAEHVLLGLTALGVRS